jgi:Holliday junction resolvase-like predicted endonuclease
VGLAKGSDLETLSLGLDWREFEAFAEKIFASFGFSTVRNLRLRKPTMEIDLVASRAGFSFVADCKHWKRNVGPASMTRIGERQTVRAKRIANDGSLRKVMPMILTLRDESLFVLENGVPVVPIQRLPDFILNWEETTAKISIFEGSELQETLFSSR